MGLLDFLEKYPKYERRKTYYKTGQLKEFTDWVIYKIGSSFIEKKEGEHEEYFESGKLKYKTRFLNNFEDGYFYRYYENGQVSSEGFLKTVIINYDSKKHSEDLAQRNEDYKNGIPVVERNLQPIGVDRFFHHQKIGLHRSYYRNGQIKSSSWYHNGLPEGPEESYNEAGQLINRKVYKEGKIIQQ